MDGRSNKSDVQPDRGRHDLPPPHEHSPGLAWCVGHSRDSGIWRKMRCCIIAAADPCPGRPDHETRAWRGPAGPLPASGRSG